MLDLLTRPFRSMSFVLGLALFAAFGGEQKSAKPPEFPNLEPFLEEDDAWSEILKTPFEDLDVDAKVAELMQLDSQRADAMTKLKRKGPQE